MDSRNVKKIIVDWPEFLSYDNSDDKIKSFYSEQEGEKTKSSSIFYGKRLLDIFLLAMAIGKQSGTRTKLVNKSRSMPRSALTEEEIWMMTCVALTEEEGELKVLTEPKDIVNICEEYANTGIRKLIALDYGSSISDPLEPYEELLSKKLTEAVK